MTLKMIDEAPVSPEDSLEIDGQQVTEVSFFIYTYKKVIIVGRIIARSEEQMRVMFEINDNTGTSKIIFYQKDQG